MNRNQINHEIIKFHAKNGGFGGHPSGHALRLLREVVELCVACGADRARIQKAILEELDKATMRGELGTYTEEGMAEEVADCEILLTVFKHYFFYDQEQEEVAIMRKLGICKERKWEADLDGVLWRPGTKTAGELDDCGESS